MDVLKRIRKLVEVEYALGDMYRLCAGFFPDVAEAFQKLGREEDAHARILEGIEADIAKSPDGWKSGKYSEEAINILLREIKSVMKDVDEKKVDARYALTRLRGFEDAMVDKHPEFALEHPDRERTKGLLAISLAYQEHSKRLRELEQKIWGKPDKKK